MSANLYIDNIQKYFLRYCELLNLSNQSGLTNSSVLAEDLFCPVLNIIFEWNLVNANKLTTNQKAYDLIDTDKQVYVQVTARQDHRKKYSETVTAFGTVKKSTESQLIVLFITNKIAKDLQTPITANDSSCYAADISWLMKKIRHLDAAKLEKIAKLLQAEVEPVPLANVVAQNKAKLPSQQNLAPQIKEFYIKRTELEKQLYEFCQISHGLLVGGPGYGKSLLINALQSDYYRKGIPCYVIRINELAVGDQQEVADALGLDADWLAVLANTEAHPGGKKGLIIFDAYDTAKEERLKALIFKQIRLTINSLSSNWHVLVTTRTYDATKSFALQELFPSQRINKNITCRYMEVPAFTDAELNEIYDNNTNLAKAVNICTPTMKDLLKIPYFMGLFEQMIRENQQDNGALNAIETESQLLAYYWSRNVEFNTKAQIFANNLTTVLLEANSLVTEMHLVVTEQNSEVFEELLRHNIIGTTGSRGQLIGFTHNILLEFGINRYILCDDVQKQIALIDKNEKLPFLFMQSFLYFYNDLWNDHPDRFYAHYFAIKNISKPVFRLFHQTILNYVLISSYTTYQQLQPLLDELDISKRAEGLRKALESLRFIFKNTMRPQDVELLHILTGQLHPILIWEVGLGIETALNQHNFKDNPDIQSTLGAAARQFMQYVLLERQSSINKQWIEANSGHWGIRNLCKTYYTEPEKSKEIIAEILLLLKEEDFPLSYFHTLSDCIAEIYTSDADFAAHVYKTIYFHTEQSTEATNMGGGAVLNLRSNRKQDYEANYYALEQKFPILLKINFVKAMQLGTEIVNRVSKARSYSGDKTTYTIALGDTSGSLAINQSYYEDDEQHGPFTHGRAIFDFIDGADPLLVSSDTMQTWLLELALTIEASSLWRKLLLLLARKVEDFVSFSYKLLNNKIFFECDETLHEAITLLHALWPYLKPLEAQQIETSILSLKHPEPLYSNAQWTIIRVKKILSGISVSSLHLQDSIEFITQHGTSENERIVKSGISVAKSSALTQEDRYIHAGFNTDDVQDKNDFELYDQVDSYNRLFYNNQKPKVTKKTYKKAYDAAVKLFELAKNSSYRNEQMRNMCGYAINNLASTLSKHLKKLEPEEITFIREVGLFYIGLTSLKNLTYEEGSLSDRSSGAYGPTARTAAISTLLNLLYYSHDDQIKIIIVDCIYDNTKIIRFKALHSLEYLWINDPALFWQIIAKRREVESDAGCIRQLIAALCYDSVISGNLPQINETSKILLRRLKDHDDETNREIWQAYAVLQLLRLLRHDKEDAFNTVRDGLDIKEFCRNLCFEIRRSLNAINGSPDFLVQLGKCDVFFEVLKEILSQRYTSLNTSGLLAESAQGDFEIIDHTIQNIYFAVHYERGNSDAQTLTLSERSGLFERFIPILDFAAAASAHLDSGFMVAHTGYYFMQILNVLVDIHPEKALKLSTIVVECAAKNGFTYDRTTLREVVKLAEKLIVDHKAILGNTENFRNLIMILDQFEQSGSQEALQLTWSLKELF